LLVSIKRKVYRLSIPLLLFTKAVPIILDRFEYWEVFFGKLWYLHCAIGFMDYSYHFNALRDYLKLKPRYSDKPIDSFIQVIMIVLGRWDRY
jgi:miniconductance mechanosensitive channel